MYNAIKANKKFDHNVSGSIVLILLLFTIFMVRFVNIAAEKKVRGNLAYVQLLNLGLPIIDSNYFDEDAYVESDVTIASIALEAANINGLNPVSLISYEIPYLKNDELINENNPSTSVFNSFKLSDGSVAKLNPEELNGIGNNSVTASAAYDPKLKKTLNQAKPEVLIYHTHTTESYLPSNRDSTDENLNVVGVGDVLANELEQNYGISVIHDKTMHSASYEDSYTRSNETVSKYLKKYGDFKLIIDLHRDAIGSSNKSAFALNINNETVAKIMFVTAKNSSYYKDNEAMAESLNSIARGLFPGFSKGIHPYNRGKGAFNQGLSKNSVLIEVGADGNTATESKASAKYIGRIIAEKLNGKQ